MSDFPPYLPIARGDDDEPDFRGFLLERVRRYGGVANYGRCVGVNADRIRFWLREGKHISFEAADRLLLADGMGRRMEEFWPDEFARVDEAA